MMMLFTGEDGKKNETWEEGRGRSGLFQHRACTRVIIIDLILSDF